MKIALSKWQKSLNRIKVDKEPKNFRSFLQFQCYWSAQSLNFTHFHLQRTQIWYLTGHVQCLIAIWLRNNHFDMLQLTIHEFLWNVHWSMDVGELQPCCVHVKRTSGSRLSAAKVLGTCHKCVWELRYRLHRLGPVDQLLQPQQHGLQLHRGLSDVQLAHQQFQLFLHLNHDHKNRNVLENWHKFGIYVVVNLILCLNLISFLLKVSESYQKRDFNINSDLASNNLLVNHH